MKTLLLNPPSFEKFDGGAGARFAATHEVTSFWYPTWLAYPAGLIRDSRLLDAPSQPGFPRVFYLKYHGYSKYFPFWALARYRTLRRKGTGGCTPGS